MDAAIIRTFLTVVATENFVAAADRLFVTQSAVSLRIQKLEAELGHKLFTRSKAGVQLTQHGRKFEHYARTLAQVWDEARYQVALPAGYQGTLSLACQESLWPELSAHWLINLSRKMPDIAFHFRIGDQGNLANAMLRGLVDISVLYAPQIRPGFKVEHIMDDRLVLVSAIKDHSGELKDDYVFENWGEEFSIAHARWYPGLEAPQLTLRTGNNLPRFLIENCKTAFLPYRVADDYVAAGELHFVKNAPTFDFPAFAVWTKYKDKTLLEPALEELRQAAKNAPWIEL